MSVIIILTSISVIKFGVFDTLVALFLVAAVTNAVVILIMLFNYHTLEVEGSSDEREFD